MSARRMLIKRLFDIFMCLIAFPIVIFLIVFISLIIKLTSHGTIFYWSDRVGLGGVIFKMPKFRTMKVGTPLLATHLLDNSSTFLTPVGGFIRKLSLDELPQLWSILIGDMTFVGPRPALFNQDDLIALRKKYGVDMLVPGLTGWAQVNGRDELSVPAKVQLDIDYMNNQSFWFDVKIILLTFFKAIKGSGVSH